MLRDDSEMKIRMGFVSNSSSSSFIVGTKDNHRRSVTKFINELVVAVRNIIEDKKDKYSDIMPIDVVLKRLDDEIHNGVYTYGYDSNRNTIDDDCMYGVKFEGGKRRYIYPYCNKTCGGHVSDFCGSISWIIRAVLRREKRIESDDFIIEMDEEWY